MSKRLEKINELIREEVSRAILENVEPGDFVTVMAVETTPDIKHSTVWLSILGNEKETLAHILEKKNIIQHEVTSKMATKYTPKIDFRIDHSQEYVQKIQELLKDEGE